MSDRMNDEGRLEADMRAWVSQLVDEKVRAGMEPQEARRQALIEAGGVDQVREEVRAQRPGAALENGVRDARYALRSLRRTPGFAVVAALTLALGIGATTAIYSAVNAVLLRPLPFPEADRLMVLWLNNQREQIQRDVTSYPNFLDWRDAPSFESMAGYNPDIAAFAGDGETEEYTGAWVTGEFFDVLGVRPQIGRALGEEHTSGGRHQVVVLSYGLWARRYGADASVIGRSIRIDGSAYDVIGVMPQGVSYPGGAEFWLPIPTDVEGWQQAATARGSLWLSVIGRLREGATVKQADAELATIMSRIGEDFPPAASNGVFIEPVRDTMVGSVRPGLLILLGAVAFVLLIACVNVANLLLARGAARRQELAVRSALGATASRLGSQVMIESLVLSVIGGALGLLLAYLGTRLLVAASPSDLPRLDGVRLDGTVMLFALAITLLTGLVFGFAPALQARAAGLAGTLREGGRGGSGAKLARTRRMLVTVEVALALMLLVGAGLLVRSFAALQSVDPGFRTERVLSFRLTASAARYPEPQHVRQFQTDLLERLHALAGVESATGITTLFLSRLPNMSPVAIEGRPPASEADPIVSVTSDFVHPSFFDAMDIPIVRGRAFEPADVAGATPVVIVNETFAQRFFPDSDPIGSRFTRGDPQDTSAVWQTIIGVAADTRRSGLSEPVRPEAYRPTTQLTPRSMQVLVLTAGPPLDVVRAVRGAVTELDADMALSQLGTVEGALAEALATRRFIMFLLATFAVLAVTLAAVGIYGVLAYLVGQRSRELGIRMALGAERAEVLRLVFRQSLEHVLPGLVVGALGALALTRLLRSQLFGVRPTDPLTFIGVVLLLTGVALVATWLPARRAVRTSPLEALRYD